MSDLQKFKTKIPKDITNSFCTVEYGFRSNVEWRVVETNYKDYLIVYSCQYGKDNIYAYTREPVPSNFNQETIQNILNANFGSDYKSKLDLHDAFQSDSECNYIQK